MGRYECSDCDFKKQCNFVGLGDKGDNRHMTITFGFEFEQSDYNKLAKAAQLACKEHELQESENAVKGKEQSLQEHESALRTRELEQQQRQAEQSAQKKSRRMLLWQTTNLT